MEKAKKKKSKKKKENFRDKIKKYSVSDWILLSIFILLIIVIIILGFKIHDKKVALSKDPKADFSIPIIEEGSVYEFMIDAKELVKKDDYILKITNVKGDKKSEEDVKFTMEITNETGALLQMMKNKNARNLLSNENISIVEDVIKATDTNIYYHLKMPSSSKVKDDDTIKFKITS